VPIRVRANVPFVQANAKENIQRFKTVNCPTCSSCLFVTILQPLFVIDAIKYHLLVSLFEIIEKIKQQAIAKAKANNEPAILKSTIPGSGLGLFLHKTVEAGESIFRKTRKHSSRCERKKQKTKKANGSPITADECWALIKRNQCQLVPTCAHCSADFRFWTERLVIESACNNSWREQQLQTRPHKSDRKPGVNRSNRQRQNQPISTVWHALPTLCCVKMSHNHDAKDGCRMVITRATMMIWQAGQIRIAIAIVVGKVIRALRKPNVADNYRVQQKNTCLDRNKRSMQRLIASGMQQWHSIKRRCLRSNVSRLVKRRLPRTDVIIGDNNIVIADWLDCIQRNWNKKIRTADPLTKEYRFQYFCFVWRLF